MKVEHGIATVAGLVGAFVLFDAGFGWGMVSTSQPVSWEQRYQCGEFLVNASFSEDLTVLYVEGVPEPLTLAPSQSGVLYQNGLFAFYFANEELQIFNVETGVLLAECVPVVEETAG